MSPAAPLGAPASSYKTYQLYMNRVPTRVWS